MKLPSIALAPVVCVVLMAPSVAHASSISFNVYVDTSGLIGSAAGPFSLDFQLTDGSGTGTGNNTASLSNFLFGGGGAAGSPTLFGGASGSLAAGAALTDTSFFNEFTESFTPGNFLTFDVTLTTYVEGGGTPDEFSFAILDSGGSELPTVGFFDVFVLIDIDTSTPPIIVFAGDPNRPPIAGGAGIDVPEPTITPLAPPVPEPSTLLLLAAGLATCGRRLRARA